MEDAPQPIVIKRIVAGHGHHGGGWKVAFADFATAMMAFFLLMWLMGSTSADQKGGISEYFENPSAVQGISPTPSPTAVQGQGGPSSAMIDMGGSMEQYKNKAPAKDEEDTDPTKEALEKAAKEAERAETKQLENLKQELEQAIELEASLQPFKDQIMMDLTAEGLRIQIVDKENRSMFDLGGATLKDYTLGLLLKLAKAIDTVPNHISISGHTDPSKYMRQNYSNWELSTDRANSARRALIVGGLPEEKIGRVVGLADSALLDTERPSNPINRRISIIVMNARTEQAIKQESGVTVGAQANATTATLHAAITPLAPAIAAAPKAVTVTPPIHPTIAGTTAH
ncbi:MAG: flagellar motor protein MotB [Steroidobacteraceae bacterium]